MLYLQCLCLIVNSPSDFLVINAQPDGYYYLNKGISLSGVEIV